MGGMLLAQHTGGVEMSVAGGSSRIECVWVEWWRTQDEVALLYSHSVTRKKAQFAF